MALVGVPDGGLKPQGPQRAHAADSQDDLLQDPHLLVAPVQAGGQIPIPWRIGLHIGVQQEEGDASNPHLPDRDVDRPAVQIDLDEQPLAVRQESRTDRGIRSGERLVPGLLPPVGGDPLVKVPLRIKEADADQRDAEIAGLLAVVAGQDAEPAAVNRDRLVEGELGGEIGDQMLGLVGVPAGEPGVAGAHVLVEREQHRLVATQERRVGGGRQGALRAQLAEQLDRIVRGQCPEGTVEGFEQRAGFGVPAPPEVMRHLPEPAERGWQVGRALGRREWVVHRASFGKTIGRTLLYKWGKGKNRANVEKVSGFRPEPLRTPAGPGRAGEKRR